MWTAAYHRSRLVNDEGTFSIVMPYVTSKDCQILQAALVLLTCVCQEIICCQLKNILILSENVLNSYTRLRLSVAQFLCQSSAMLHPIQQDSSRQNTHQHPEFQLAWRLTS